MAYICFGLPYWIGEYRENSAVEAIKQSGIAQKLGAEWIDIEPEAGGDDAVVALNRALATAIKQNADKTPLIFSGDCVNVLGAMKGLEAQNPDVLWYDAHGDFNTEETTPSGFLGGMPLAALVGRGNKALMQGIGLSPIAENKVIITDARDLDPEEGEMLASSDLLHLKSVSELSAQNFDDSPLYIHFDTDVVNTTDMPAMNYPAEGGPDLQKTLDSLAHVVSQANVVAVLFSLWNQQKAGADIALNSTLKVVETLTMPAGS